MQPPNERRTDLPRLLQRNFHNSPIRTGISSSGSFSQEDAFGFPLASVVDQIYCNLAPHTFVIAIQLLLFPSDCTIVHCFAVDGRVQINATPRLHILLAGRMEIVSCNSYVNTHTRRSKVPYPDRPGCSLSSSLLAISSDLTLN